MTTRDVRLLPGKEAVMAGEVVFFYGIAPDKIHDLFRWERQVGPNFHMGSMSGVRDGKVGVYAWIRKA